MGSDGLGRSSRRLLRLSALVSGWALAALSAAWAQERSVPEFVGRSELIRTVGDVRDDPRAGLLASGLDPAMLGGVPEGEVVPGSLALSLTAALRRGLAQNLGVLLREQQLRRARGERIEDRGALLPSIFAAISQRSQEFNFAASAFSGFRLPSGADAVVDFDTFDARLFVAAPLWDRPARMRHRAAEARVEAAAHTLQEMRNLVVLFVGNLYLRNLTAKSRAHAIEAETRTAESLRDLAVARHQSGLVSEIDVLRSQFRLERDRQRLIVAGNQSAKAKLRLARAIGLPVGQQFHLIDSIRFVALDGVTQAGALQRAYSERPDYLGLQERLAAARAERKAAKSERLPKIDLVADYGGLGSEPSTTRGTFNASARLSIPLFEGGRIRGETLAKDAELRALEWRLADLEALVYYQVQEALLDLGSSTEEVRVTQRALELAGRQLEQARDRFAAGVSSNLEVIAAQEAIALVHESELDALLAHRLAKGALARAVGVDEETIIAALVEEVATAAAGEERR